MDGQFLSSMGVFIFENRKGGRTYDFAFHKFVWAVYEFFHFCFPDLGVALEGCTGEPQGKVFD